MPEDDKLNNRQPPQRRQRVLLTSDEIQTPARGNCTIFSRMITASYATQIVLWSKLTRMYEREDWKKKLEGVKDDDAFILRRPLSFNPAAVPAKAQAGD